MASTMKLVRDAPIQARGEHSDPCAEEKRCLKDPEFLMCWYVLIAVQWLAAQLRGSKEVFCSRLKCPACFFYLFVVG